MNLLRARNDIRVWRRQRHNRTIWFAHDPNQHETLCFQTEAQLKGWLDNYDRGTGPHRVRLWPAGGPNVTPLHFTRATFMPMGTQRQ
jgi:hypothetical protein